jgi:hypothetical protein
MAEASDLFTSAWLKWGWAVVEAEALKADLKAFALNTEREGLVTASHQYDAQHHCFRIRVATIREIPERVSLRLGNVVHNYRSCLDNVAWALVARGRRAGSLTESQESRVAFPLAKERKDFNSAINNRLPGARHADIALVRRYQPYRRGKTLYRHALAVLATLSNLDKHREIQPVWVIPTGGTYEVTDVTDCVVTRTPKLAQTRPLQVGTEITRIYVRKTGPDPDIQVYFELSGIPALNERLGLQEWLDQTRGYIVTLLQELGDPPLEEMLGLGLRAPIS